ncbi:cadherin-like and PC-esterase domain-containing protein 1 isoform X2 [Dysidea avara]|uniref:cadherin-like and PC-esterase domain-containing protein 1 isoform X2 n=1 Tax=Dysidea avara TaxID=196820 RepID=UPI0033305D69
MRRRTRTKLYACLVVCFVLLGCHHYRSSKLHSTVPATRKPSLLLTSLIPTRRTSLAVDGGHKTSWSQTEASTETQGSLVQQITNTEAGQITSFKSYDGVQDKFATPSPLLQYLEKLEKQQLPPVDMMSSVIVTGIHSVISRDTASYRRAFAKNNFSVLNSVEMESTIRGDKWRALLCLSYSGARECFQDIQFSKLKHYQKISHIPGIRLTLGKKDALCQVTSPVNARLAPTCWVMPHQYEEFVNTATSAGKDEMTFFVKPISSGSEWRSRVVNLEKPGDVKYIESRRFHQQGGVIQQYFHNQLFIVDKPFSVRAYVLITSMSPLRVYMYNEGIVYFRTNKHKSHHRLSTRDPWCFAQLKEHLQTARGLQAAEAVFKNMELAIVQLLLRVELSVAAYYGTIGGDPITGQPYRCQNCYQLLGIDLVINTSLHVMISEVNGQPNMQENFQEYVSTLSSIKEQMLYDLVRLVFSRDTTASNVSTIIDQLYAGLMVMGCKPDHKYCLTDSDLHYLFSWQRETNNIGNYKQLYPAILHENILTAEFIHGARVKNILLGKQQHIIITENNREGTFHSTKELHHLFVDVLKLNGNDQETKSIPLNIKYSEHAMQHLTPQKVILPVQQPQIEEGYFDALIGNVLGGKKTTTTLSCTKSVEQMPYLLQLVVSPGQLQPYFTKQVTQYRMVVPHIIPMISISAIPAHCSCIAKFVTDSTNLRMDIFNQVNWTLSVGDTTVQWLLLDTNQNQPWVINQYTIIITRQSLSLFELHFTTSQPHKVCALTQDCDLMVYQDRPCGLYEMGPDTWQEFQLQHSKKPKCSSGDSSGHWMLPCVQCTKPSTCFWNEAVWTPKSCRHVNLNRDQSRYCTSNKKILMIGDSTCRGIMYYLIEKINGSLQHWTNSHSSITYTINDGTVFSFQYYPQYWVPQHHSPSYEQALDILLKENKPLSNNSGTILIVGGVQWMNYSHIKVTQQILNRADLTGITVIIKGLGSGFSQPSTGIHWVPLEGHRELISLQESLSQSASQLGYHMIDTLSITITRHKHFLYGSCACNFHRVLPLNSSLTKLYSLQTEASNNRTGYHVFGNINAVYSEIVLNVICNSVIND